MNWVHEKSRRYPKNSTEMLRVPMNNFHKCLQLFSSNFESCRRQSSQPIPMQTSQLSCWALESFGQPPFFFSFEQRQMSKILNVPLSGWSQFERERKIKRNCQMSFRRGSMMGNAMMAAESVCKHTWIVKHYADK